MESLSPKECGRGGGVNSVSERRWRLRSRCVRGHSVKMLSQVAEGSVYCCMLAPYWSPLVCHNSQVTFTLKSQTAFNVCCISCNLSPSTRDPKRKAIQTIEMSTCQLLVAISSHLPQLRIGPQNKYRAGSHARRMWMPRANCFLRGRSSRAPLSCALGDL